MTGGGQVKVVVWHIVMMGVCCDVEYGCIGDTCIMVYVCVWW